MRVNGRNHGAICGIGSTPAGVLLLRAPRRYDDLDRRARLALATLTPHEELIVRLRFGVEEGHSLTAAEVGRRLSVPRRRIRQIEANALRKLRHPGALPAVAHARRRMARCTGP